MSEAHFDEFEHYNFDQDKAMRSGHSGKQNFWNQNLLNIIENFSMTIVLNIVGSF